MLSKFLVRKFIKDYTNIENYKVRDAYGYLGGIVGIVINIILLIVKFIIGIIANSISVTADGFNNLSEAISSIIAIIGFKMASKPADKEHPFGHGRVEYISGLIVSFMVLLVGVECIKSSYGRITKPFEPMELIARVKALLKRYHINESQSINVIKIQDILLLCHIKDLEMKNIM